MLDVGLTFYKNMPMLTPRDVGICKCRYDGLCNTFGFVRSEMVEFKFTKWMLDLMDLVANTYKFVTENGDVWYVSNTRLSEDKIHGIIEAHGLTNVLSFITDGFWSVRTKAVVWDNCLVDALSEFSVVL